MAVVALNGMVYWSLMHLYSELGYDGGDCLINASTGCHKDEVPLCPPPLGYVPSANARTWLHRFDSLTYLILSHVLVDGNTVHLSAQYVATPQ